MIDLKTKTPGGKVSEISMIDFIHHDSSHPMDHNSDISEQKAINQ